MRTVLGVSNISFGLPQREKLAGPFLTLALGAGLDAAILNPLSRGHDGCLAGCPDPHGPG